MRGSFAFGITEDPVLEESLREEGELAQMMRSAGLDEWRELVLHILVSIASLLPG